MSRNKNQIKDAK